MTNEERQEAARQQLGVVPLTPEDFQGSHVRQPTVVTESNEQYQEKLSERIDRHVAQVAENTKALMNQKRINYEAKHGPMAESNELESNQNSVTSSSAAERVKTFDRVKLPDGRELYWDTSALVIRYNKSEDGEDWTCYFNEWDAFEALANLAAERVSSEARERQLRDALEKYVHSHDVLERTDYNLKALCQCSKCVKSRALLSASVVPTTTPTNERRVDGYWGVQNPDGYVDFGTLELSESAAIEKQLWGTGKTWGHFQHQGFKVAPCSLLIHEAATNDE